METLLAIRALRPALPPACPRGPASLALLWCLWWPGDTPVLVPPWEPCVPEATQGAQESLVPRGEPSGCQPWPRRPGAWAAGGSAGHAAVQWGGTPVPQTGSESGPGVGGRADRRGSGRPTERPARTRPWLPSSVTAASSLCASSCPLWPPIKCPGLTVRCPGTLLGTDSEFPLSSQAKASLFLGVGWGPWMGGLPPDSASLWLLPGAS